MEKIYQVFVSSTFQDLQEERKEVMQALLELDCMPAGMELFPASNDDQWTLIKRVIDACDYYLLIIGGRYGSTNDEGKSYTQMEFEYALETGKPIISFLPKKPEDIPTGKCEKDPDKQEKLERFKELAQKKLVKYWESPEQLGSIVSRSMIKLIKDFPAEGWVRAGSAVDERSLKEISKLQKENEELKSRLQEIATEPPKGTNNFSQGEDKVDVSFLCTGYSKQSKVFECHTAIELSWNEIYQSVAPLMIDECTEHALARTLNNLLEKNKAKIKKKEAFADYREFANFRIDREAFDLIKVQFKALGLICLSSKKRSTKDTGTYWSLTPYGDFTMTKLLAIRK